MIESPVLKRFLDEGVAAARREDILTVLTARFGPPSEEVRTALQTIEGQSRLEELVKTAASCPDLEAFRGQLPPA